MRSLVVIGRFTALVALGASTAFLWFAITGFFEVELRAIGLSNSAAARATTMLALLVPLLVPAIPLAALFRHRAAIAAIAIGWPPLVVTVVHATDYSGSVSLALIVGFALLEGGLYWLAIFAGAWMASRFWPASGATAQSMGA
jgi:hypothetical protein